MLALSAANCCSDVEQFVAPCARFALAVIHADDLHLSIEQAVHRQVVQRRHQQPFGQVAARAEDHQRARRRGMLAGERCGYRLYRQLSAVSAG